MKAINFILHLQYFSVSIDHFLISFSNNLPVIAFIFKVLEKLQDIFAFQFRDIPEDNRSFSEKVYLPWFTIHLVTRRNMKNIVDVC